MKKLRLGYVVLISLIVFTACDRMQNPMKDIVKAPDLLASVTATGALYYPADIGRF